MMQGARGAKWVRSAKKDVAMGLEWPKARQTADDWRAEPDDGRWGVDHGGLLV